jgi:hypothetical protein
MHPVVRCKEHEGSRRPLIDICETNEYGEVRVPLLIIYPLPHLQSVDCSPSILQHLQAGSSRTVARASPQSAAARLRPRGGLFRCSGA